MIITTTVCGIPCQAELIDYQPYQPATWDYPEEGFIEIGILDRRGYPAPWLERKLTPEESARIESEMLQHMKKEKYEQVF